jgi:hypothetical protein
MNRRDTEDIALGYSFPHIQIESVPQAGVSHQRRPHPIPCHALLACFAFGQGYGAGDRYDLAEGAHRNGTSSFRKIFA